MQDKYGQPRQLIQYELATILNSPTVKLDDAEAFDDFALSTYALVGMLRSLEGQNVYKLRRGSHVDRLLRKMPQNYWYVFVVYCFTHSILKTGTDQIYTISDLAAWLQRKSQAKLIVSRAVALYECVTLKPTKKDQRASSRPKKRSASTYFNSSEDPNSQESASSIPPSKPKPYCPHCDNKEHYLNVCPEFKKLNTGEIIEWIKDGQLCWNGGQSHKLDACVTNLFVV